ncbi:MAG: Rieske 2Fe-2S domain-containing protein [Chitinophagales bacterium]
MSENDLKWEKLHLPELMSPAEIENGQLVQAECESKKYCLSKVNDNWYAIRDTCPHASASLSKGFMVKGQVVVCPLHRAKFDICSGKNISGEGYGMRSYPVKQEDDQLYLGLTDKNWYEFWK